MFGVLPFCALGLLIGSRVNASAAPAIVNFIYLPMAFLSGLWMPLSMLPEFIRSIAPLWPPYHLAQLALVTAGQLPVAGVGRAPVVSCRIHRDLFRDRAALAGAGRMNQFGAGATVMRPCIGVAVSGYMGIAGFGVFFRHRRIAISLELACSTTFRAIGKLDDCMRNAHDGDIAMRNGSRG